MIGCCGDLSEATKLERSRGVRGGKCKKQTKKFDFRFLQMVSQRFVSSDPPLLSMRRVVRAVDDSRFEDIATKDWRRFEKNEKQSKSFASYVSREREGARDRKGYQSKASVVVKTTDTK